MDPSIDNALSVAVVGAGPAGIYASEALLKWADENEREIRIELIERLPVPFGLLRYGVAPDHPRIKGISRVLHGIIEDPRIEFLGAVELGTDITIDELRERNNAVVLTTGALTDRRLTIPGSDARNVWGAAEFVTWYDGHPDAAAEWGLEAERVAVVGLGNVALDVARMLLRTDDELDPTDIPQTVRAAFASGATSEVTIVGRRGPWDAKFTVKELRELDTVENLEIIVDPADLADPTAASLELEESERRVKQNIAQFAKWAEGHDDPAASAETALAEGRRVLRLQFFAAPSEVATDDEGTARALVVEHTAPGNGGGLRSTGEFSELPAEAVYTAVGYRSSPIIGVPFDEDPAVIPNDAGRVLEEGAPVSGLYTAGWIKRGPTGVIGTNRSCASETVASLLTDLEAGLLSAVPASEVESTRSLLVERGVPVVDDAGRHAIEEHEIALGESSGRERTKVSSREELIAIAMAAQSASAHS